MSNINVADINKKTPLIGASELGTYELIELLLQNGANPNHQDKEGIHLL